MWTETAPATLLSCPIIHTEVSQYRWVNLHPFLRHAQHTKYHLQAMRFDLRFLLLSAVSCQSPPHNKPIHPSFGRTLLEWLRFWPQPNEFSRSRDTSLLDDSLYLLPVARTPHKNMGMRCFKLSQDVNLLLGKFSAFRL